MSATDERPLALDCPTCGRIIPEPLAVDPAGRVECPGGHRVPGGEVVPR